jgi:hypothetical protein
MGGYWIVTRTEAHDRLVDLSFDGISEPAFGPAFPSSARGQVLLGALRGGTYPIHLRINGDLVPARLVVHPDSFEVLHGDGPWTRFPTPVLHRVPPGIIWGLISWGPADQSARVQAFLDGLASIGAREVRLAPGDYDYFHIGGDGQIVTRQAREAEFLFSFSGDSTALSRVMRWYAGPVSIRIHDSIGRAWSAG